MRLSSFVVLALVAIVACAGAPPTIVPSSKPTPAIPTVASAPSPSSSSSTSASTASEAPTCTVDVPPDAKDRPLAIGEGYFDADVVAGDARDLWIGVKNPPGPVGPYRRIDVCAKWTVAPPGLATIDDRGHLVVGAAAAGKTLIVTATLADGTVMSQDIPVANASVAPLVGNWHEVERQWCGTNGAWLKAPNPIGELHVTASGGFAVTWSPVESYVDYFGTYAYDATTGALALTVTGGADVPKDVKPKGTARFENGMLVLNGIYLGSKFSSDLKACGHRFAK